MRHARLLLVVALVGCGSTATRDDPRPTVIERPQDSPPAASNEGPDFGEPRPPVRVSKKPPETESTRDELLRGDKH